MTDIPDLQPDEPLEDEEGYDDEDWLWEEEEWDDDEDDWDED